MLPNDLQNYFFRNNMVECNVPKKDLTETRMNKYHGCSKLGWLMFIWVKVIPDISGLVANPRWDLLWKSWMDILIAIFNYFVC